MKLIFDRVNDGIEFRVQGPAGPLAVADWAVGSAPVLQSGRPARVGILLRLLEDGAAETRVGEALFLSHESIAALGESERQLVGLPSSAGMTLELRGIGGFHDRDFRIERRLLNSIGRPVVNPRVNGCFVHIGDSEIVLPEPLYSLWEGVGQFNDQAADARTRLLTWGRLREHLPEQAMLDEELKSIQVVVPSGFALSPFRNENGEPDFDPTLGRWIERGDGSDPSTRAFEEALAPAQLEEFARHFRARRAVQDRYLGGDGVYIFLPDRLRRALKVVREVQGADAGSRRRFLTRPSSFLRDALDAEAESQGVAPEEGLVDDVFFDEGLSERVKGVGIWEPKVIPWLLPSGQKWLPGDPAGIRIDDENVEVPPDRRVELLEKVREARREGRTEVEFEGRIIPATEETERALEDLIEATVIEREPVDGDSEPNSPRTAKLALLIIDNINQLGFRMAPRGARESTGRLPRGLTASLLPHQESGLRWLQQHWTAGSPGALLADDMGLGKTLQALTFMAWVREEMAAGHWPQRPILVVAPTGLLRNWEDEHGMHLGGQGLGRLNEAFGAGLRRIRSARDVEGRELATGLPSLDIGALRSSDWVMTTYETLRDYQHSFAQIRWAVAIFDEAQKIKNPAAGLTDAAKALKPDFLLAMTGTPVENRIEDLWSIVDAARPGELGALKDFSARFRHEDPSRVQTELAELHEDLTVRSTPPIMLRRLKEDHLEGLPSKEIVVYRREMPPRQADAYREAVVAARRGAPMLQILGQFRDISLHPDPDVISGDDSFIAGSARLSLTFEILDDIRSRGEKALVFLESRSVQSALAEILQRRYQLPDRILVINGEVSGVVRKARVDEFQARPGFDVMILSPRAGGVGLTLTAANHVIHLARWWNPAVEDQCTDRVYRIRQERPVKVYNVVAVHPEFGEHSFDLRLADLLARKRTLNRSVLAPAGETNADLQDLYRSTVVE